MQKNEQQIWCAISAVVIVASVIFAVLLVLTAVAMTKKVGCPAEPVRARSMRRR
jgi:hypothetical protein